MKESNKLIAEFMDVNLIEGQLGEYHTSWDWLMPVVEEMHTYGCEIVISSNGVTTIYSDKGKVLAEESSEEENHMHDATYKAIVKVLKENLHKPCE